MIRLISEYGFEECFDCKNRFLGCPVYALIALDYPILNIKILISKLGAECLSNTSCKSLAVDHMFLEKVRDAENNSQRNKIVTN
jgi:hypothetical protein